MPSFSELWDGFEHVCTRAEDGERFYVSFHKIVAKLEAVESKYVKGLMSLKSLFADSQTIPTGSLKRGWAVQEAEFLKYLDDRSQWTKDLSELAEKILEQKKAFNLDRRVLEERGKGYLRDLAALESKCEKARKAYLDGIKAFQEASETYKGIAAERVKTRAKAEKTAQKKKKESQELDSQYYEAVKELKLGQDNHYNVLMPELLKDFETIEGIRTDNVRALLEGYLNYSSHLGPNMAAQHHRCMRATDAINSRADIDEFVNEHRPTVPPPPRARYESHDGIIREITESIGPNETPRGGSKAPKKGIFSKKQPKTPTEGLQSQRLKPAAKVSGRLDADSSKVTMTEGKKPSVSMNVSHPEISTTTTHTPSVQISSAPPQVQYIEPASVHHNAPAEAGAAGEQESVVALYDYTADEEGELTFAEGDIIHIIAKDPSGWWRGKLNNGDEGDFPSNYVGPIGEGSAGAEEPEAESEPEHHEPEHHEPERHAVPEAVASVENAVEQVVHETEAAEEAAGDTAADEEGEEDDEEKPVDANYVAMYDYEAEESGELTIVKDQVLFVFTERGGWFYGRNEGGQVGLFPSNYVDRVET